MTVFRLRCLAALLALAGGGCGSPSHDPNPDPSATSADLVLEREPGPLATDAVHIVGALVEGADLTLSLRHAGGCRVHRFGLHMLLPPPPGDRPTLDLNLSHDAGGDACEALLSPVVRVDLRPLQRLLAPRRAAVLRIYQPGAAAPSAELPYSF